jgi:uncharacterized HAD superfamily protein
LWFEVERVDLGFDVDGVIADFVSGFANAVKRRYGLVLREEDVCHHDLGLVLGISEGEKDRLIRETMRENLPLITGARESLARLYDHGHRIVIMTWRPREFADSTREWLRSKDISYSELVFLDSGGRRADPINVDMVVEDNLENAIEWSQKVKKVLLYDHPWNRSLNIEKLFRRVYSWKEALEEIKAQFSA